MSTNFQSTVQAEHKGSYKSRKVRLPANFVASLGEILVSVNGLAAYPAAANKDTGVCCGVVVQPADNTGGADGDKVAFCHDWILDLKNDGTNPVDASYNNKKVYGKSKDTISSSAADGPYIGILKEFGVTKISGRPCRVALDVGP